MQQPKDMERVKPYHNNVRKYIKQQGYTIQEVADEIGISRRTLTNYVTGTSPIPRAYLEKIAYTIGCDVEELMARPTQSDEQKTTPTLPTNAQNNQTSPIVLLTSEQKEMLQSLLNLDSDLLTQKLETASSTTITRRMLLQEMMGIMGLAFTLSPGLHPPVESGKNMINDDLMKLFENNMSAHWELYHTGGAARVVSGLDAWIKEISRLTQLAEGTNWHTRTLVLLTMSYQLQSCVLRDTMNYTKSHMAYQRAFHIAQELDDSELMSSALARQGVTLIQRARPKEAIIYLSGALDITDAHSYPLLRGHTLQALAEAYAMAQKPQESWENIGQAENFLIGKVDTQERSLTRGVTAASLAAQKGVNAFLLHNSQEAVQLIDKSLATYDPALIRGRARLLAQRAEAYYELGIIDACSSDALTALSLARSAGSNKTEARVRTLYTTLAQSPWGKGTERHPTWYKALDGIMRRTSRVSGLIALLLLIPVIAWLTLYIKGKQFALRNRLRKADAIVVLAGTRGNIQYLDGKICTAVHLYHQGWAPKIICTGKFSVKITETPTLIPLEDLQLAVTNGRIQQKDVANAARTWDIALGATYMRDRAIQMCVPPEAIIVEDTSLHTRENAEQVLSILKQHGMSRIILVTSPFHQLRTYLTFAKVLQPHNIKIINYYADTDEWHPMTWFLSEEHRKLVKSETERIKLYREKGDLL